ncbi:sensor domain-containing diguanylate cyclase [Acidithiobacillus ferrianus]|uniref:Diguanylate cyclase n=2 Tax=Acidithiobacillus ferrianus TaxID=2678518 RepID=A0A845U6D3_9PROT|nr:sensor domain-containing diguanylate cyclase [Acidithiobacillus ferrianus]NDU43192.1 diguanylate cyclase [Acidithiobacillus ferrianus]
MNILLSLVLLFGCGLTYRLFSRRRRRRWEAEARTRLLQAMLEIDRLLGDSLTLPLALTFNQLTNTLSRRLGAPLVWLGTQESTQEPVRLIAVAGGRKSVALDWSIPVLGPAAEGSVARAIQTGEVLLCALRGDASYAHWAIGDDSRLRFGVAIPFRSLGGTMGVIGVFAPSRERLSVVRNPLWNRLADDLSVFLERRKNAVDVSHIPGYQLAISDLLREILGVSHMSAAYDLVLSLLVERMGALGAWLVEAGRGQAVSEMRWVAMRWRDSEATTQRWCANVENMQSEIGQIVRELALREQSKIISVRDSEMLRRCRDSYHAFAQLEALGAWPVFGENGLHAVLFVASAAPDYFGTSLQVLLRQVCEALHIAMRQLGNVAEIRRRTLLYQALLDEGDIVLTMQGEQPLMEETCRRLVSGTLFATAWIGCFEKDDQLRTLASAVDGDASPSMTGFSPQEEKLIRQTWQTHPRVSPVLHMDPKMRDATVSPALALIPILRGGHRWGILAVRSTAMASFSADVLELLQRIASLLGHGLDELDLKRELADEQYRQSWLATHDPLTALNNRRGLDVYFNHAMMRVQRAGTWLAVVIIDLDDFKPINDTYGHEVGDRLLVAVAQGMQSVVRNTDFLVRLGGDEFVLLLEGLHSVRDLEQVMNSIRVAVETPVFVAEGVSVQVGCSAGLTLFPMDQSSADALLRHADEALYVAKRTKKTRTQYWANHLDLSDLDRMLLEN